jgi:hypothetical protein
VAVFAFPLYHFAFLAVNAFLSWEGTGDLTVFQYREATTQVVQASKIDVGNHYTGATRQVVEDNAPWIDNHAMAVGFTLVGVVATLCGSDHVAAVLDGAGAYQNVPVGFTGDFGK